ncbi:response regulator transcription factor [Sphingomonas sp. LM7]|uniref:response regulator n=1 Tax=Sphingomonas sp. LM7 TaxID=1938607 RepID=UPI000983C895|nr:response regulator transcription factor [Sphingomonas sp. LM7]AQR75716.1 DNA-binding response regulator [Sphingomonas sp. LM7]
MTAKQPIRILIADDHPMLRDGVAALLDTQPDMLLVGEASDGADAIRRFAALRPDVTLMDLQMPGMGGVAAIRAIREQAPRARILVLTTYDGDAQAAEALRAGAAGFLLKTTLRRELLDTIRAIHAGRRYVPPEIAQEIALHASDDALSQREQSVLALVAEGLANKEIAWELGLAEDTIKTHLKNVFAKLGVADRTLAVTTAMRRGILNG